MGICIATESCNSSCECVPAIINPDDHFSITIILEDEDGVQKNEFEKSLLDQIYPEVIVTREDPNALGATVKVSMIANSGTDFTDLLGFTIQITSDDFETNAEQYTITNSALTQIATADKDTGSYNIRAEVTSEWDEDIDPNNDEQFLSNNDDTALAIITTSTTVGEQGSTIAAPEIHPIFILLIILSIVAIIRRK